MSPSTVPSRHQACRRPTRCRTSAAWPGRALPEPSFRPAWATWRALSGTLLGIRFRREGTSRDTARRHLTPNFGVHDMAIDLGTANTLVYVGVRGIVVSETSVVASDVESGIVHAVGHDAERLVGGT